MRALVVAAAVVIACQPDLPEGEIGCSDGRCPPGFGCSSGRCIRLESFDADGIPDVGDQDTNIEDAGVDADAFSPPRLEEAWVVYFGGTGADQALGATIVGSDLVVVGSLSPDATFDDVAVDVRRNEEAFLVRIPPDGNVGEVELWSSDNVTRLADVVSDGSRFYLAGSWNGTLTTDRLTSTGFRSGWVGVFESDAFTTLSTWVGPGSQVASSITLSGDELLVGGQADGQLEIDGVPQSTDDQDGVIVELETDGTLIDARLVTGSVDGDRIAAVAVNMAGNLRYAAGRVGSATGFDAYLVELVNDDVDTRSGDGLVSATSLAVPAPAQVCVGGHYEGDIDLGFGTESPTADAAYVQCFDGGDVSRVFNFDGTGVDRIQALTIGGGVMVAAGEFSATLDLGFGGRNAIDQDAFVVVLDPFVDTRIADAAFGGNGEVRVHAVEALDLDGRTRIYVVGSFASQLSFAGIPATARGSSDGFIAAFDLIH